MGLNRQLVETVKRHFAQKSTADLEEIVRREDRDQWSEEAFVAAAEVLTERGAGRAAEPRVPVKDEPPPSADERWGALFSAFGFVAGDLVGGLLDLTRKQDGDQPVAFGSDVAWLAVETRDTPAVASALGLYGLREATWGEGIAATRRLAEVFVTPPLGDWTLAVGTALFPLDQLEAFVKPLLGQLTRRFHEVQYFCTHRRVELYAWARAQKGRPLRGYGWLGRHSLTLWNQGTPSQEERDLGFRFVTEGAVAPVETDDVGTPETPDESCVLQLASLWSVDPTALDEHFQEPVFGIVGDVVH